MTPFSFRILFLVLLFSFVSIEGRSQTALPEMTKDVSLEIVDYEISDYPVFSAKITNSSDESIRFLKFDLGHNVPDFYRLILDPYYDYRIDSEAISKTDSFFIEIEPGDSCEFSINLDYRSLTNIPVEAQEVDMYITYQYDPAKDLESSLSWYPKTRNRWNSDEPLRGEIEPLMNKLSPLRLKSQTIRFKIPR